MDIRIATALSLSRELVWFSRQSFAEEVASLPSGGLDTSGSGSACNYSGYTPAKQQHVDIDGTFALDTVTKVEPAAILLPPMSPVNPSEPRHDAAEPDVPSSAPFPGLMVTQSPVQMGSFSAPITISHLQDLAVPHRQVDLAAWQTVTLLEAFAADRRQPDIGKLRDLAQQTHLTVSTISRWFAKQRRSCRLRMKFGFCFSAPVYSRTSIRRRTLKIYTSGHCRRH